jgi:hypothetical protein
MSNDNNNILPHVGNVRLHPSLNLRRDSNAPNVGYCIARKRFRITTVVFLFQVRQIYERRTMLTSMDANLG